MNIPGIDTTKVRTSTEGSEFKLGTVGTPYEDNRMYLYVEASEAIAVGNVVVVHEDYKATNVDLAATAPGAGAGLPIGLAVVAIASGGFGWVQCNGPGDVKAKASTGSSAHTRLNSIATAGQVDTNNLTGSEVMMGFTLTEAAVANKAACLLVHPYVGSTL